MNLTDRYEWLLNRKIDKLEDELNKDTSVMKTDEMEKHCFLVLELIDDIKNFQFSGGLHIILLKESYRLERLSLQMDI